MIIIEHNRVTASLGEMEILLLKDILTKLLSFLKNRDNAVERMKKTSEIKDKQKKIKASEKIKNS